MYIKEKYEILEIIYKGTTSMVYKVKDIHLNRYLIIKESSYSYGVERQEGAIMKECFHPAIPTVIDVLIDEERQYLVMEYVKGITLADYLEERGTLEQRQIQELGRQLFDVLCYLHGQQPAIVYGDIKPENIMITQDGKLKLIDFGSAFYVGGKSEKRSGTLGYAAPELMENGEADERSDIYSMGCLFHYMLTGENPCKPPYLRRPVDECGKAIGQNIQKMLNKALAVKPKDRFPDMKTFMNAFRCMEKPYWKTSIFCHILRALEMICLCGATFMMYTNTLGLSLKDFLRGEWKWRIIVIFISIGLILHLGLSKKGKRRRPAFYMQKNIWKTEKRGIGLFLLMFILGITGMTVNAEMSKKTLPIQLYSEKGYKVCVREGEFFTLNGALRMELPRACLEGSGEREVLIIVKNPVTNEEEWGKVKILLGEE